MPPGRTAEASSISRPRTDGEAQAGARRQGARGDQGRQLAERVAGVERRVRLAGRLPVGERRR